MTQNEYNLLREALVDKLNNLLAEIFENDQSAKKPKEEKTEAVVETSKKEKKENK